MITWPGLADAVRQGAARPAAALHVLGRPGGLIRLRAGEVTAAWTPGTPLAAPTPDPASRPVPTVGALARIALADALFVMAAGRVTAWRVDDEPPRPDEDAGRGPEPAGAGVPALLAEVDRRIRRVAGRDGLLPPEETHVRLLAPPAGRQLLLPTAQERRVLDALANSDSGRTVRDLAFVLGRAVFAVLLDVQRLAAMGSVGLAALPLAPPRPELVVQAGTLDGPSGIAVSAALRRRRAELGGEPPPPPTRLVRRVPGAGTDRTRRRVPWLPRRPPPEADERRTGSEDR